MPLKIHRMGQGLKRSKKECVLDNGSLLQANGNPLNKAIKSLEVTSCFDILNK
jgi:hypothetical protein